MASRNNDAKYKYGPQMIRANGVDQINECLGRGVRVFLVWLQEITVQSRDGRRAIKANGTDKEINSSEGLFGIQKQLP